MPTIAIIIICLTAFLITVMLTGIKIEFRFLKSKRNIPGNSDSTNFDKLSNAEFGVLKKMAEGKTNKQIAGELFISENTVKKHISGIFKKLEVSSRSEIRKYKDKLIPRTK